MTVSQSNTAQPPTAVGHILLVEDIASHVELICRGLVGVADQITVVGSLEGARTALHGDYPIDLLIVDLGLPDGWGTELLAEASIADVKPVIILTAQGDEHRAVEALKQGALDYVPKSATSMANMATIVKRVLREWENILARREAESALQLLNAELEQRVKQRTAELQEAYDKLQELTNLKDEFVANISHELRTPLSNLQLYHTLLRLRKDDQEKYLKVLDKETERLIGIVENLLRISRYEHSDPQINLEAVDLCDLVRNLVSERRLLAEERDLTLSFQPPEVPCKLWADPGLLDRVLDILFTNALQYTTAGGHILFEVEQYQDKHREWAMLTVQDNGLGIAEPEMNQIFERFFRGEAAKQTAVPGIGLGLAIAKEIIERHDGYIAVESEGVPGKGSKFTIWIPVVPLKPAVS